MTLHLDNLPKNLPEEMEEEKPKIKRVKLAKHSNPGRGNMEDVAIKVIENEIKKYVAGTSLELINEFIKLGYDIRTKYEDLAFNEGFKDVNSFIKHVVDFYLYWKDNITKMMEELKRLRAENILLRSVSSPEIKRLIKLNLLKEIMIYSVVFNANKELVEYWINYINQALNDDSGQANRISFTDIEPAEGEHNKGDGNTSKNTSKNT